MSTISLRLPESLHRTVRELAERDKVSINQFITVALAEKISALMTEEYLGERARRGGGVAGLLLAALGLGRAWSDPAPHSQCEDFCRACPGISPASGFGECVSSCEACVNSTGGQLPCSCPTSPGGAVVCGRSNGSACTSGSQCCSGACDHGAVAGTPSGTCVFCIPELHRGCASNSDCCSGGVCEIGTCVV